MLAATYSEKERLYTARPTSAFARLAENLDCFTLVKEESGYERYKNVTLYASWTKASGDPENPGKDMVKEPKSTGRQRKKSNLQQRSARITSWISSPSRSRRNWQIRM